MSEPDTNPATRTITFDTVQNGGEVLPGELLEKLPVKPQDRYKFIRSIGFGGMKGVLLVRDRDTGREMAMAIMPDFRERSRNDLERFVAEALLTANLEHPNIVPVYDIGIDTNGSPFFTMKYLRGFSLGTLLKRLKRGEADQIRDFPQQRLLLIFQRICNAVAFAHSRGVCHLDLKPGNINIGDFGETLVLDWGLARKLDQKGEISSLHEGGKGTPGYMPPEQIDPRRGIPLGIHSDIYALGAILYSMLALEPPCADMPVEEVLIRTTRGTIPRPSEAAPANWPVPASLEAIAMKAMSPDIANRYASVDELRQDLLAYGSGFATKAENASALKKAELFVSRNYLLVIIAILVVIQLCQIVKYFLVKYGLA